MSRYLGGVNRVLAEEKRKNVKYYKLLFGYNFEVDRQVNLPEDDPVLMSKSSYYDARTNSLGASVNFTNWKWYLNYIDLVGVIARNTMGKSRCTYLLNNGYIPVIYLPTDVVKANYDLEVKLFELLDCQEIPYVRLRKTSFIDRKIDIEGSDAWVSKMDMSEILGCKPYQVTTRAVLKEVFGIDG